MTISDCFFTLFIISFFWPTAFFSFCFYSSGISTCFILRSVRTILIFFTQNIFTI
nr:MAG TPA_asm: hypothetical protein [Caudoviricetes sp.]